MRSAGSLADFRALGIGDHVGWLVESPAQYEAVTASWAEAGALDGDRVVLFGPESKVGRHSTTTGVFATADPAVHFLHGGPLDPALMFESFRREAAAARDEGFRGLRVIADMDWLKACFPTPDALADFELRLDEVVVETGSTVVCAYRPTTFDAATAARALSVHPLEVGRAGNDLGFSVWFDGADAWVVSGEVDLTNVDAFAGALHTIATSAASSTVLLSKLGFIDVVGMRTMARIASAHPRLRIRTEGTTETVRRCMSLLDLAPFANGVEGARGAGETS